MRYIIALLFFILVSVGVNGWVTNHRDKIPAQFALLGPTTPNQLHEFRIALKQRNVDILEATLLDVSNPVSNNYGKWWTSDKILDLIAPSEESIQPVISWLKSHPISEIDVSGRDFIKVVARIEVIESMFNTEMHDFRSKETGRIVARVFGFVHVPDDLMDVVEMVTGLTELVPKSKTGLTRDTHTMRAKREAQQANDPLGAIFPGLLRAMYNIPSEFAVHPNSSIGLIEFQNDTSFNQQSITGFNKQMNESVSVSNIVGPFYPTNPDDEPNLHVQYGGSIALDTTTWFWTVENWMYEFAVDIFNAKKHPLVVSMSWGWDENDQCTAGAHCISNTTQGSYDYVNRVNVEYIKLGLKGITLVAAAGDQGALGNQNDDCQSNILSSQFPASSPWVTAVGATMLITDPGTKNLTLNFPPACSKIYCARTKREGVCSYPGGWITSGGGFSNVSSTPGWQRKDVRSYLKSGVQLPTGLFDPTKRAYPDVAVNGHNYLFFYGTVHQYDGTAASTPVFAGMIALLNSVMLNHRRHPLGFVNPLLYKMAADDASTFTDITTGNNYCSSICCSQIGYVATTGWDPVSGLGTPVFSNMQSYIQKTLINK